MDTFLSNQGNIENDVPLAEPCTYHRRGHWFKSITAHHASHHFAHKSLFTNVWISELMVCR